MVIDSYVEGLESYPGQPPNAGDKEFAAFLSKPTAATVITKLLLAMASIAAFLPTTIKQLRIHKRKSLKSLNLDQELSPHLLKLESCCRYLLC